MNSSYCNDDVWLSVPHGSLSSCLCDERPITVDEACAIRLLLFGNTALPFKDGWIDQGFRFRNFPSYALIQKRSGPCGIIAAIQAYVLYELLFGQTCTCLDEESLKPTINQSKEALARALGSILWQAGENLQAFVVKKGKEVIFDKSVTTCLLLGDRVLEYVKVKHFKSLDSLLAYLYNFINEVMSKGGCILFLYSLLLTRGIDRIKEEMDCPSSFLIGDDGFCSQEIINLILIGKAVPNLHNGDIELNSGGEETSLLRGIPNQSKIGFLTMYEYQDNCLVGSFYKDPYFPVWVLQEENHYTVMFGISTDISENLDKFTLFYVDCLERKNEEACLTISPKARLQPKKSRKLPVLFRCILTKWPHADIEMHATS